MGEAGGMAPNERRARRRRANGFPIPIHGRAERGATEL